jgi:hypothetical protein
MNYTKININGEDISLKFGMASFRYLADKFVSGISFDDSGFNEIGISHLIYSGYYNWCLVKVEKPKYSFEDFVDYVEANLANEKFIEEIKEVVKVWSDSDYIKSSIAEASNEEPKKKTSRGMKSKPSHLAS